MTIYDIAREAGVSASTVSRVINKRPGISESTRKKVQKILDEYHYIPDVAARGLVTQASRFIGILIEDIRVSHHTESAYVIEQEMTRKGYTCITFSTGGDSKKKAQYIQILEQRRVEGAIFIGSMFGIEEVKESVKQHLSNIPIVVMNGDLDLPNTYSVQTDEERGMEEAVALLAQKGRKNLAYLMDVANPANKRKQRGFTTGMLRLGMEGAERMIFAEVDGTAGPRSSVERGRMETVELLKKMPAVDGILCETDMLAVGCMKELKRQGIRIPEQTAIIGVDNTLYGQVCTPTLTTIDNKSGDMSLAAANMLMDVLQGRPVNHRMILPAEVIRREST